MGRRWQQAALASVLSVSLKMELEVLVKTLERKSVLNPRVV